MVIHIDIPAETEIELRKQAAAEGKDPMAFALEALFEKLTGANGSSLEKRSSDRSAAWNRFTANMQAWGRSLPAGHQVDDSRDGIYEGRGE